MSEQSGGSQDRARAARVLVNVLYRNKTTDQSFGAAANFGRRAGAQQGGTEDLDPGSPLLQELVYGTLRHYFTIEPKVAAHLSKSFRSKDLDLRCLLLVGAYQLYFMRIPAHAVINETVNACRGLRKPWARGLVNAVLRALATEIETMGSSDALLTDHSFGLPDWMAARLRAAYPTDSEAVMTATLERAPMSLRVNLSRARPADVLRLLQEAGITAHQGWRPEHLILEQPLPVRTLPGHAEGLVSIQDAGAQFAAPLVAEALGSVSGARDAPVPARVLDACAAPGGKLFHIAELMPDATLVGVELSAGRLAHLETEAARLGHTRVELRQGNATESGWHDRTPFDVILLDAPCSGSGTLRRHPDIKILRQPEDLPRYSALQNQLLDNLWTLLRPGGSLIYCTCSLFTEENDAVIESFLSRHRDAEVHPLNLPTGRATRHGWQLVPLPATSETTDGANRSVDGFFFARITRRCEAR